MPHFSQFTSLMSPKSTQKSSQSPHCLVAPLSPIRHHRLFWSPRPSWNHLTSFPDPSLLSIPPYVLSLATPLKYFLSISRVYFPHTGISVLDKRLFLPSYPRSPPFLSFCCANLRSCFPARPIFSLNIFRIRFICKLFCSKIALLHKKQPKIFQGQSTIAPMHKKHFVPWTIRKSAISRDCESKSSLPAAKFSSKTWFLPL